MTLSIGNVVVKQNSEGTGPQEGELSTRFEVIETPTHQTDADGNRYQVVKLKSLND